MGEIWVRWNGRAVLITWDGRRYAASLYVGEAGRVARRWLGPTVTAALAWARKAVRA